MAECCVKSEAPTDYMNEAYEKKVAPYKQILFSLLQSHITCRGEQVRVIVELGIGGFSNAPYYMGCENTRIIGIEPDTKKHAVAMSRAHAFGLQLCLVPNFAENLPLSTNSVDAVVSTCTLCTVHDPQKALAEIKRVLKPDGVFAFWEHVLSETDSELAARQIEATPEEFRCWGCRFDRRTLEEVKAAKFTSVQGIDFNGAGETCYFDIPESSDLMSPTVAGIAFP
jgi:SAM-dependent methyltransferase